MKITVNKKELYAVPINHPITCANPGFWKIEEISISDKNYGKVNICIRGNKSMWFNINDCYVTDSEVEAEYYSIEKEFERKKNSLYFSYST